MHYYNGIIIFICYVEDIISKIVMIVGYMFLKAMKFLKCFNYNCDQCFSYS